MDKDVLKWAIIENIVIIITSGLLVYFVSPWCLVMLLGCNSIKSRTTDHG
jgi:hypothetical protein